MPFKPTSVRLKPAHAVLSVSIALLLVIFGIFGVLIWQAYGQIIEQARAKAQSATDVVAEQVPWMVNAGLALLARVEDASYGSSAPSATRLGDLAAGFPVPVTVGVFDASGAALGSRGPQLPANVTDAPFFKALSSGQAWYLSAQQSVAHDGEPILLLSRRVSKGGVFAGAAVLAISGGLLDKLWGDLQLGTDSTISLVRTDGWVLARHPQLAQPLNLSSADIFPGVLAHDSGSYLSPVSPADGVARVVAYRHVAGLPLISFASVSQAVVLSQLWASAWTVTFLLLPLSLALLLVALLSAGLLNRGERSQAQLKQALRQNQVLFREIHHRVKNNLQAVSSLIHLQPIPAETKRDLGHRIAAMSAVHEHIYRSDRFTTVEAGNYLHTLIGQLVETYGGGVEIVEHLDAVEVSHNVAMPLGLLVNEVVSNSLKHAFPDDRQGVLTVRLRREDDGGARLDIEDNGIGFDQSVRSQGIGRRLVTALVEQVGGTSEVTSGPEGVRFSLRFVAMSADDAVQTG